MPSLHEIQEWFGPNISAPLSRQPDETHIDRGSMRIYQEQYWFRLLSVLQETFPKLVERYGHADFNREIGMPYLEACPPNSWELSRLGERLPGWLTDPEDKRDAAIDLAHEQSFGAAELEPISGDPLELLDAPVRLQPYLVLLEEGPTAVFRRESRPLHPDEFRLLRAIESGSSLRQAVELLDDAPDLAYWVQNWILHFWLCRRT